MFPRPGRAPNCSPSDVNQLTAILYQSRRATLETAPRLLRYTKFVIIDELIDHLPFHFFDHESSLPDMRRYLNVLAEALRCFKEDVQALQHEFRDKWYKGITNLCDISQKVVRKCSKDWQVEAWDVAVLLKHCQYLVLSISDLHSKGDILFEFGGRVITGVLQGYGNQYADALQTANTLLSRKRQSADWHEIHLQLEQLCFISIARIGDGSMEQTPTTTTWNEQELETLILLKDQLDDELMKDDGLGFGQAAKTLGGKLGEKFQSSGPYEENRYYFEYSLLNLMYFLLLRIQNRVACFEEIVGATQLVLERSTSNFLHRKAIDLYNSIKVLGTADSVSYGRADDEKWIGDWMVQHETEFDTEENTRQYVKKVERKLI